MKAEIENQSIAIISARQLSIGEVMQVMDGSSTYNGEILLRTYDMLISLSNPRNTWSTGVTIRGVRLPKGTQITLTIDR